MCDNNITTGSVQRDESNADIFIIMFYDKAFSTVCELTFGLKFMFCNQLLLNCVVMDCHYWDGDNMEHIYSNKNRPFDQLRHQDTSNRAYFLSYSI